MKIRIKPLLIGFFQLTLMVCFLFIVYGLYISVILHGRAP